MVTLTVENGGSVPPMGRGIAAVRELGLRVVGAALQILATVAVVQALAPPVAGIYFRGAVICYGLAALLRGKYDLFVAQHFIDPAEIRSGEEHARAVVRGLGIRVLIRSAIACALLLVFTTDMDVMDVYLRPYLQTYLAVRARRSLCDLGPVSRQHTARSESHARQCHGLQLQHQRDDHRGGRATSDGDAGCAAVCRLVGFFHRLRARRRHGRASDPTRVRCAEDIRSYMELSESEWRDIYTSTGRNGVTGVALAALQWGPACVLAVLGTAIEIAQYAVAHPHGSDHRFPGSSRDFHAAQRAHPVPLVLRRCTARAASSPSISPCRSLRPPPAWLRWAS